MGNKILVQLIDRIALFLIIGSLLTFFILILMSEDTHITIKPINLTDQRIDKVFIITGYYYFGIDGEALRREPEDYFTAYFYEPGEYIVRVEFKDGSFRTSSPRQAKPGWFIHERIESDSIDQHIRSY